jgi:hypothetical protein
MNYGKFVRIGKKGLKKLNKRFNAKITKSDVKDFMNFNHSANLRLDGICIDCNFGDCINNI